MTNARTLLLLSLCTALCGSFASAQAPTIQPLGWLDNGVKQSVAMGVSPDGTLVVGHSRSRSGYDRAFLWTSANGIQELGTLGAVPGNSYAEAVTEASGGIVVGSSAGPYGLVQAFRWAGSTGMTNLGGYYYALDSHARDISHNGQFVAGDSYYSGDIQAPTRWVYGSGASNVLSYAGSAPAVNDAGYFCANVYYSGTGTGPLTRGYTSLSGWLSGGTECFVEAMATNAATSVGHYVFGGKFVATRWNGINPIVLHSSSVNSYAYDVSGDGLVAVGEVATGSAIRGDAYVWFSDRSPAFLKDYLVNEYGVDMTGWGRLYAANSVSADGRVIVGSGEYQGATTAFRVFLPLTNRRPTVTSSLTQGQTYVVPLGTTFAATFAGQDLDGDTLTLVPSGLPASAALTPNAGSNGAPPFNVGLSFTPTLSDVGSHAAKVAFADVAYAGNPGAIGFTLTVPPNNLPTATAPNAETVECDGDLMVVELSTTVSDADEHPMTVVWKVNGQVEQTTPNVASGSAVAFEHAYGDGENVVTVEVNDSFETGTASTTVTVEDTTAPVVVVAENLQVPTNPGKNFATGVTLTPPSVTDLCDGEPTLTNNAPSQYPLGVTTVTWTATDADGNQATATQKVTVVDQEKPKLAAPAAVRRFVDPGKLLSTARLTPPAATDNVPAGLKVTSNAPTSFRLGLTVVTWTAKDAAGNTATAKQNVTVVNRAPKANAGKAIVVATTSEKGATATLNGSASSDPDKHVLKYRWAAPGVSLKGPTTAKPSGVFPIGTKTVTLTVTDPAGAKSTAKVTVTVKLQNAKKRARGKQANEAFAKTFHHGTRDAVNSAPNAKSLAGYTYANAAQRIAIYAGDHVQWNEGQSPADATLEYAELRALQSLCGERAAAAYLDAYAETGDEDALHAGLWALNGAAYAEADVSGR